MRTLAFASGLVAALWKPAVATVLTFDAEEAKNRPVSKVINLLKDMLKELEKDAEQDEEIYDKMACWCETNEKEKTKSIAEAEARIEDLKTKIEQYAALSAQLASEIKNLEKEVEENQNSLAKATAIREKQLAEFTAEEKDLLQSISALKAAVTVLGKHQSASFLQVNVNNIKGDLQNAINRHMDLLKGAILPSQRKAVMAFIQTPAPEYAPQSGEIFGILEQMKETFEANLASSQKEEATNQKAYDELKAAKEEEIQAGQEQIDAKVQQKAETDEKHAVAKTDKEDTEASLDADQQFLAMLKEKCAMSDDEWDERQKTRQLEMEAVSKALEILSGDDAHDLFTKTFNFMETASSASSLRRDEASKLLSQAGLKLHSPRLSNLASSVKLDAFTKVKKAIDDMIAELLQEKADEIKHKDFCTEEFNTNLLQTEDKTREKKDLIAQIEDLDMEIKALGEAIDKLKAEIKEMQVQMKRAGENREKENKVFQTTVSDQRATQQLLKAALKVLEGFYKQKAAAALVQQEPVGPAPPPGFDKYENNKHSGGVMEMISMIMADAKKVEEEAIRSEEDAQKAYEDFVKDTNKSIKAKGEDIVNKSETKAKSEDARVEANKAKEAVLVELDQLAEYKNELHASCDFVMKNFELRQTARDEEVEALRKAKSILSGAKFSEFLQSS